LGGLVLRENSSSFISISENEPPKYNNDSSLNIVNDTTMAEIDNRT
jgi:hypothetical protein